MLRTVAQVSSLKYSTLTLLALFLLAGATHSGYAMNYAVGAMNKAKEATPLVEENQNPAAGAQLAHDTIEANKIYFLTYRERTLPGQ